MSDFWLAAELEYSDGRVVRFGPDERDAGDVPIAMDWTTQIPGGYGSGSIVLERPPVLRADDAKLFSSVRIYGPGVRTYYEGRVAGQPQVGPSEVRLELEGHSAALDDNECFRALIIDRDLSRWQGMSNQRRLDLLTGDPHKGFFDPQVVWDPAGPRLQTAVEGDWDTDLPTCEAWYSANNLAIARFIFEWGNGPTIDWSVSDWQWDALLANDDVFGGGLFDWTGNLRAIGPQLDSLDATTADRRYAVVRVLYNVPNSTGHASTTYPVYWNPAVIGAHTIPIQGDGGPVDSLGVFGHDVITYVLDQLAPNLNYVVGDSIEQSPVVIHHLVFLDDTTGAEVVRQTTALGSNAPYANDWGVYDGKMFFWRTPGTYGRSWRVRREDSATPTSQGPEAKRRIAGIKITYRDGAGRTHSVGPPGSTADFETELLLDTNPDNPATRVTKKFAHETVGIADQNQAISIGRYLLTDRNRAGWKGDIEVIGEAKDSAGNLFPACAMRAGDQITVEDDEAAEERPINSTTYDWPSMKLTAHVGELPDSGEVFLAQLAASSELVG